MSKNNTRQKATEAPVKPVATPLPGEQRAFTIPFPMLLLALAVLVVYFPSFSLGFTELDDTIFVREFKAFNEDTHNLVTAFTRGLFDAVKDPYYRPLFADSMILNYQMSGEEPHGYHVVNVLLHMLSVTLLYRLAIMLGIRAVHAFIIGLVFAVHPVLVQAVSWIPGRNDTMLAVFVLLFLQFSVRYVKSRDMLHLVLSGFFLLCAYFTKETAVFAAPAAFVLLVLYTGKRWNDRPMLVQYALWVVCFGVWYAARSAATIQASGIGTSGAFSDLVHRLPVIIQYIGKIVLPINQSVFPTQDDTVLWYGLLAAALLAVAILLHKSGDKKAVLAAVLVFILFLMPALLVPDELNRQTFEHRLYLPMIGILLLLPHTVLLTNKFSPRDLTIIWGVVCIVFAGLNYRHQQNFSDPLTFWTQAVETSPNSAYANMMMAARLDKSTELKTSEAMFRKAYKLNPNEKYLNFYMAEMLQQKDSVLASENYLLREKEISDYYMCDFYLARVYMTKGDRQNAMISLERYLSRDAYNPMAHNNLLLLYMELGFWDKAKELVAKMRRYNMPVPPAIMTQLGITN